MSKGDAGSNRRNIELDFYIRGLKCKCLLSMQALTIQLILYN